MGLPGRTAESEKARGGAINGLWQSHGVYRNENWSIYMGKTYIDGLQPNSKRNVRAMASKLQGMASNLDAMVCNLIAIPSHLWVPF